ncbi:hypothetical protein KTAU_40330 [Thermogemmatispora aurantia]|uniref:Uncharacterized protein n=1 Tax=Thermogemmatispora aurantia TaxID=2045279 RepID=A0A5J4K9Z6_9CHLR|nr:hypothetical protein KTAU_40330 [Thermogemmatispora aurantia]
MESAGPGSEASRELSARAGKRGTPCLIINISTERWERQWPRLQQSAANPLPPQLPIPLHLAWPHLP